MRAPCRVYGAHRHNAMIRLAQVLKTITHQCIILYTCSQSYSDGSVLKLHTL